MSAKARKLGRGLDSLIRSSAEAESDAPTLDPTNPSNPAPEAASPESAAAETPPESLEGPAKGLREIDPREIAVNRVQPRQKFETNKIEELADSIRVHGILQPLVVQSRPDGEVELIAGERRLRAALHLQLERVPVVMREVAEQDLLGLALIENIQREDLNPIELAEAYHTLKETRGWTQNQLAEHLGKKRSSVANTLRYLDLPKSMQESLAVGQISEGHVKVLLSVADPQRRHLLHDRLIAESWTVRELEAEVRRVQPNRGAPTSTTDRRTPASKERDPQLIAEEERLSTLIGTKVQIQPGARGRGRLVLEYYSADDLDRLCRRLSARGEG